MIRTAQVASANMSENDLRVSLQTLVASNCCWGKKPAAEMSISNVNPMNSYHCMWESFMEKRSTSYKSRPYKGDGVVFSLRAHG